MTLQEMIDTSLAAISYIASGESATASDSAEALSALNRMMAEWRFDGKDLNYPPQDTLSDPAPIPEWAEQAVIDCLGVACAKHFAVDPPITVASDAMSGRKFIEKVLLNNAISEQEFPHIHTGAARTNNIRNG